MNVNKEDDERAEQAFTMYKSGMSFSAIAKVMGVSRQAITWKLKNRYPDYFGRKVVSIYPNIQKWMDDNNINYQQMADKLGVRVKGVINRLTGVVDFKYSEIKILMSWSGMTFAVAFKKY